MLKSEKIQARSQLIPSLGGRGGGVQGGGGGSFSWKMYQRIFRLEILPYSFII